MGSSATERPLFVDDVITALTGGMGGVPPQSLRSRMERAAVEFDERTAEAFARALFVELAANPQDTRGLEALIILGLSHPAVLARHGISLETEGRRLAATLEHAGQSERARQILELLSGNLAGAGPGVEQDLAGVMRRSGNTEEMVERLLRRADECIARGYTGEAIQNLQEVLLLDRNRRDVARMIRDLRWGERERGVQRKRFFKLALVSIVVGLAGTGLVLRERHVRERWDELPPAVAGDPVALQSRLDALEALLAEERIWGGVLQAWSERDRLRADVLQLQSDAARVAREGALERKERAQQAEDARERGLMLAQQGRFDAALADLQAALELGGGAWEHRPRVLADIQAIESWRARKP